MTSLILLLSFSSSLLACKDGDPQDSQSTDDSSVTDDTSDTGDTQPVVAGEDLVFHDGTRMIVFYNVDYALETDGQPAQEVGGGSNWTAFGDFDGDSFDDLWQMPDAGDKTSVYMNNGSGTWNVDADFTPDANVSAKRPVVAGDFDGDGKDDIGLFNTTNGRFVVFPLRVASFSTDDKVSTDTTLGEVGTYTAADMNGDGWDDIVQLAGSDVRIYRVVDGALVDATNPWWEGRVPGAVNAIGLDLDDDGTAELATWSGSTLTVYGVTESGPDLESSVDFKLGATGTPHAAHVR